MNASDLAQYVNGTPGDGYVVECWEEAVWLVHSLGDLDAVPTDVLERCYLEAGAELYHRKNAPNGISQFAAFDGTPVRVARDPLVPVYPLLKRWVVFF